MKKYAGGARRTAVAAVAAAALALGLAACGDEDSSDGTTVAEEASAATVERTGATSRDAARASNDV